MSKILLKVENAGAERLWNYILAYKRMTGEASRVDEKSSPKDNAILGLMPTLEIANSISRPKRHPKKHL